MERVDMKKIKARYKYWHKIELPSWKWKKKYPALANAQYFSLQHDWTI